MASKYLKKVYILLVLALLACSDPNESNGIDLGDYEVWEIAEAKDMANYWDQNLVGSDPTFESLLESVRQVRSTWSEVLPWLKTHRYMQPWEEGTVLTSIADSSLQSVLNGSYPHYSSLPELIQPDSLVYSEYGWYVKMFIDTTVNARSASNLYEELPGIISASPNAIGWVGTATFPTKFGKVGSNWAFVMYPHSSVFDPHLFRYSDRGYVQHYDGDAIHQDQEINEIFDSIREQWNEKNQF
jgi:hypothetical protein